MKKKIIAQTVFFSKSLLWSFLLYVVCMAAINWEEFSSRKKHDGQYWVKKETSKELIPIKVSSDDLENHSKTPGIIIGYVRAIAKVIF